MRDCCSHSKRFRTTRTRASPPMPPHAWIPRSQERLPSQDPSLNERRLITRLRHFCRAKVGHFRRVPKARRPVELNLIGRDAIAIDVSKRKQLRAGGDPTSPPICAVYTRTRRTGAASSSSRGTVHPEGGLGWPGDGVQYVASALLRYREIVEVGDAVGLRPNADLPRDWFGQGVFQQSLAV